MKRVFQIALALFGFSLVLFGGLKQDIYDLNLRGFYHFDGVDSFKVFFIIAFFQFVVLISAYVRKKRSLYLLALLLFLSVLVWISEPIFHQPNYLSQYMIWSFIVVIILSVLIVIKTIEGFRKPHNKKRNKTEATYVAPIR